MPLLEFDPLVGMVAPDAAQLRDMVAANWEEAFNDGDGSPVLDTESATPAGQLVDSETMILSQINAELLYLFTQINPRLAEGVWQDALGYIYFLVRKIAQPTIVTCSCRGLYGTVIPVGAQIQDTNGYRYACINARTIGELGTVDADFQCLSAGPVECAAETATKIITVIPGWDTVNNPASGQTGWNRESQVDFENRRYESVAKNSHGAVTSLQGALWDLEGVTDCRVLENTGDDPIILHGVSIPGHSVAICIYGGDEAEIARTIYLKKDMGCGTTGNVTVTHITDEPDFPDVVYNYQIMRPTPTPFGVKVTINKTQLTPTDVERRIQDAIVADFNGQSTASGNARVSLASTVYASRFVVAVVKAAGVQDLVGIEIQLATNEGTEEEPEWEFDENDWASSVVIDGKTEPVISANDIIVDILEQ